MKTDLAETERPVGTEDQSRPRAKRLLIITIDAPFLVTHHLTLAVAARDAGYDVHIAAPYDPQSKRNDAAAIARIESEGLVCHPVPLKRSSMNPLKEASLLAALGRLIGALEPHLIHCVGMKPVLYAGAIARLKGLPAVLAVTGLGSTFMGERLRDGLRRALLITAFAFAFGNRRACVTVENPDDRAIFVRAHALNPKRSFLLRGVGADLGAFKPREAGARPLGAPPVVMLASRLIAAKGVREFAGAARRIKDRGIAARFVIVGAPDVENPGCVREEELMTWQRDGIIEWWGHRDDMPDVLREADIFCLPSFYREGVPKVLIEAAATGLALVSTDMPGCRDVVRAGVNGLIVPPRDVQALEAAILRLVTDPEFCAKAGRKSREIAAAEFSLDAYLTASLAVYRAAESAGGPRT